MRATPSTSPGIASGTLARVSKNRRPGSLDFSESQATTLVKSMTAVALVTARIAEFWIELLTPGISKIRA